MYPVLPRGTLTGGKGSSDTHAALRGHAFEEPSWAGLTLGISSVRTGRASEFARRAVVVGNANVSAAAGRQCFIESCGTSLALYLRGN